MATASFSLAQFTLHTSHRFSFPKHRPDLMILMLRNLLRCPISKAIKSHLPNVVRLLHGCLLISFTTITLDSSPLTEHLLPLPTLGLCLSCCLCLEGLHLLSWGPSPTHLPVLCLCTQHASREQTLCTFTVEASLQGDPRRTVSSVREAEGLRALSAEESIQYQHQACVINQ